MKLLKEVKDLETPNKTETIGKKPERPFAKMSKEDQGVANPVYADAVRNLEKTDELRKKGLNIDKAPEHKEKPDKIKLQPAHKKMHLSENLFEDVTTQRVLKEEVSDEAYEIAERIDNNFAGEEFISRDDFDNEFNSIAGELFQGEIDWENGTLPNGDDIYDLVTDVRGILAMKGWATIYEGEDEGGLDRTDEESVSPNKLIYNALHEYENSHYDTLTRSEQNVFNKLIDYYYNHLEDVVDKSIYEESLKKNEKSKTLKEEYGAYKDEPYCEEIASRLEDGFWNGYTENDTEWDLEVNGLSRSEFAPAFADWLAENISYPVRDGHLNYMDLDMFIAKNSITGFRDPNDAKKLIPDLVKLGIDREDIDEWLKNPNVDEELEFWIDYDINFDVDAWEDANADDEEEEDDDEEDDDLEEALSQEETRELDKLNADNHWGFDDDQLIEFIAQHKAARERNDEHTMERIEYRLTDCNFHTFCKLLMDGKYEEAREYIDTDLYESLTEKKVKENGISRC